jgi:multidrug efflux pump subunit AcrA (membrane-fusion protein)
MIVWVFYVPRRDRTSPLVWALGALCVAAVVVAVLVVGAPSDSSGAQTRTVKVQRGVVQSTVSGSGNLQAATQLNLGFETSGVVQRIYVAQGQYVTPGKLLAELNPQSAEASLEQARAALRSAEASLVQLEETGGETASGQSGAQSGSSGGASSPAHGARTTTSSAASESSEKPKQSAATREANLASARAGVNSNKLAVETAEEALADTKLYAPSEGTIVSLAGEVGQSVTATGTSKAQSSSASGSASSSSSSAGGQGGSGGTGNSSSTGSTAFAVLSDMNTMKLVVALSESEVVHVHPGQLATVTVEALEEAKLAAHVASVASIPASSSSGVVSYDVTFDLDQTASGLKPGMSASAEIVVKQEEGLNVPTSAITANSVTVLRGGKPVRQRVVTGLAGDSSTVVLAGLREGEQVVLRLASSAASRATSRLASRLGGLGGGGLGGGLAGGAPQVRVGGAGP